jgi:hypothetical protein
MKDKKEKMPKVPAPENTAIKESYEAIRNKHKQLPTFELLDTEFEISRLEDDKFLLRSIRLTIGEKLAFIAHMIGDILHPSEAGYAALREMVIFSDEEKVQISELYKKIMYFERWSLELTIQDGEELNVKYIEDVMKQWPTIKAATLKNFRKIKESWTKETAKKETGGGYFG